MPRFCNVKSYVDREKDALRIRIDKLQDLYSLIRPTVEVVQFGSDPASNSYILGKKRDCKEVGIGIIHTIIEDDADEAKLAELTRIATCPIIFQLPIDGFSNNDAVNIIAKNINPRLDVDGFTYASSECPVYPCTPSGIIDYVDHCGFEIEGMNVIIFGRGPLVGMPLASIFAMNDATVTLVHSKSKINSYPTLGENDLLVTATNQVESFDDRALSMIDPMNVIDVGLGRSSDGSLRGNISRVIVDCYRRLDRNILSGVGGVGLLTRLAFLKNVCACWYGDSWNLEEA